MSASEGYSVTLCCDHTQHERMTPRMAEMTSLTKEGGRRLVKLCGWNVNWETGETTCPVCVAQFTHPPFAKEPDHGR